MISGPSFSCRLVGAPPEFWGIGFSMRFSTDLLDKNRDLGLIDEEATPFPFQSKHSKTSICVILHCWLSCEALIYYECNVCTCRLKLMVMAHATLPSFFRLLFSFAIFSSFLATSGRPSRACSHESQSWSCPCPTCSSGVREDEKCKRGALTSIMAVMKSCRAAGESTTNRHGSVFPALERPKIRAGGFLDGH